MLKMKIISLNNCVWSMASEEYFKHIKNKEIIRVSEEEKEEYKNEKIQTFPQIYLYNENTNLLLGGFEDSKEIYDNITSTKNVDDMINTLNKKYSENTRKQNLRIIEFFIRPLN